MAVPKYTPAFPYKGNQVIVTSDRVLLHSKNDAIFLFGKTAVGISTVGTFNVDADKGVIIATPNIKLGLIADQRVIKGDDFLEQLDRILAQLQATADSLTTLKSNPEDLSKAVIDISKNATVLKETIQSVRTILVDTLSNVTYTM